MEQNLYVVRFIIAAAVCLFIGTLQGIIQVVPYVREWIHITGEAGHMVDPLAHAHISLVGGVVMAIMAFAYYALPRLLNRPIYNQVLTSLSFYFMLIGVLGWYSVLLYFGIQEGNMMLRNGISFLEAKQAYQPYHVLGILITATIMALGHWIFLTNVVMTLVRKKVPAGTFRMVESREFPKEAGV